MLSVVPGCTQKLVIVLDSHATCWSETAETRTAFSRVVGPYKYYNRGGYCNASGPLGIDLPKCQGPLKTSPEEDGWFPESRGLRPCLT